MFEATVFVVDDDSAVRESLSELVRTMGHQVESYPTAQAFLAGYDPSCSGCLILDQRMPGMSGIELQDRLNLEEIGLPVVFITGHGTIPMAVRALKAGAVEFLEKPFQPQKLRDTIRFAIEFDAKRRKRETQRNEAKARLQLLTAQERAVLEGIAAGKINKQIAAELEVSLRTVQLRRASLRRKLGVDSRVAMVQLILSAEPRNGKIP